MPLMITVEVRSVYGRDTIYPADDAARAFARIAGTTTLTVPVLKEIIGLGYEIQYRDAGRSSLMGALERLRTPNPDWCPDCNARKFDDQCVCERGM